METTDRTVIRLPEDAKISLHPSGFSVVRMPNPTAYNMRANTKTETEEKLTILLNESFEKHATEYVPLFLILSPAALLNIVSSSFVALDSLLKRARTSKIDRQQIEDLSRLLTQVDH